MPLPTNAAMAWPPKRLDAITRDINEADAWYSGDTARLEAFYAGPSKGAARSSKESEFTGLRGRWARFWERRPNSGETSRQRLHVPIAADIAAASADLLFGDPVDLTIPEAHGKTPDTGAKDTEARLAEIRDLLGLDNLLLEGAEVGAALGGVYYRPGWDHDVADHPLLSIVHADQAVPEFQWGRLTAVTFWQAVATDGDKVWRHLERHEDGVILHGLYLGDKQTLGTKIPLEAHPATEHLAKTTSDEGAIRTPEGVPGMMVRYVPNVLPNRKHRGLPIGRGDWWGTEDLMDALDETWSSWMRDIRLGKARIIVPDEFLDRGNRRGAGAHFNADQEIFTPLEIDPAHAEGAGIRPVEFKLRVEEHARTTLELVERIVGTSGYSPQTFGLQGDGAAQTATEVNAKEGKSLRTRARKARYCGSPLADICQTLLAIDRAEFGGQAEPMRPTVIFPEVASEDPRRVAETADMLRRAAAASTETLVRLVQPHLEGEELTAEVARIQGENGLVVSDPTGGLPPEPDPDPGA